jgi:uncharacterized repeat protein (TIGR03803 family)
MKTLYLIKRSIVMVVFASACLTVPAQECRILHHFAGGTNDGAWPGGTLARSGSTFYGMTYGGGSNNLGAVFKMNVDGTGFEVIHSFVSPATDGQHPLGSLIVSDGILYGLATSELTAYGGTIFKLDTDGSGFQVLRSFSTSDGVWPYGSLIQSDGMLFGLNTYGGSGNGTIFRIGTNGTGFQKLRTFTGSSSDGSGPHGALLRSGPILFGTTRVGGAYGNGTLFRVNTNGTGFQLLRSFAVGTNDGAWPCGSLILSGATLYGATGQGGIHDQGTIFSIATNGTGFQILHKFAGGAADGSQSYPGITLIQSGSILYGMTDEGGASNMGTVFQINTNGTGFQLLHSFAGGTNDGSSPCDSLILSGSTLHGMTAGGGSNSVGVIFALDLPLPQLAISTGSTSVTLSWSTNFPDFALESVAQPGEAWTSVPGVTGYSATLPVNAGMNQFFRLRR